MSESTSMMTDDSMDKFQVGLEALAQTYGMSLLTEMGMEECGEDITEIHSQNQQILALLRKSVQLYCEMENRIKEEVNNILPL